MEQWELIKHSKKSIIAGFLVAFGQAISEVGAVMIVGGNKMGDKNIYYFYSTSYSNGRIWNGNCFGCNSYSNSFYCKLWNDSSTIKR